MYDTMTNLGLLALSGAALAIGWHAGAPLGKAIGSSIEGALEGLTMPSMKSRLQLFRGAQVPAQTAEVPVPAAV